MNAKISYSFLLVMAFLLGLFFIQSAYWLSLNNASDIIELTVTTDLSKKQAKELVDHYNPNRRYSLETTITETKKRGSFPFVVCKVDTVNQDIIRHF